MIPKIIHYCWFGPNQLPKSAERCIDSWRKHFPDYEIMRWDETNFDVDAIQYTSQAYGMKKYAFVSDYARFWILYRFGGVYFDTDVEVIAPFDRILSKGAFMGREAGTNGKVAPGLGLGVEPGHPFYKEMLDEYSRFSFMKEDGTMNQKTIVNYTTEILVRKGLVMQDIEQEVDGITIYPAAIFCPMDSTTGIVRVSPETVSIHHYDCSWLDHSTLRWKLHILKNFFNRMLHFSR